MKRVYPNIRGLVDSRLENELTHFIDSLYDEIENILGISNVGKSASPSATAVGRTERKGKETSVGLSKGVYAQPLLGEGADPNMKSAIPDDVIHSNMNVTAGAVPVGGFITLTDGFGNTVDVLTK